MLRAVAIGLCLLAMPAQGQAPAQDPPTVQAVGLFEHACLPFAGYPGNLRVWAADKGLRELPGPMAAPILAGRAGKVFNASTANTKLALSSLDDGACIVAIPSGNKPAIDATLRTAFRALGATVTLMTDKVSPDNKIKQTLDLVTMDKRRWHISVTSHTHAGDMLAPPTVIIMATATS